MVDPQQMLKRIEFFDITPDYSHLSATEKQALEHCVAASKLMTEVHLEQLSPEIKRIREELKNDGSEKAHAALRYMDIHGGPWDEFNEDQVYIEGASPRPKGIAMYPEDLTKEEWDQWLAEHPSDREAFESNYTKIIREGETLKAVPYAEAYRPLLERASKELKEAANLLKEGLLKDFLNLRAEAFLSNEYRESDMLWVDTDGSPFEVTIGPYEVYADQLFGYKAMFEAFVALPDKEATEELQKFGALVPDFDKELAERIGYTPKGAATPLEVVQDVFRGGDAAFGRMFIAYNLPNDRKVHELKGSKKVFSRTMMEAKFNLIGQNIAERVLKPTDLDHYKFRNRLLFVLGHELAHGLGPGVRVVDGREVSFETLLREMHGTLEEAKADMLGVSLLHHFNTHGLVTDEELLGSVATEVLAFVQGWIASYTEAHAQGSVIEYNWLKEHGGLSYDTTKKVFDIDPEKSLKAMMALGDEFMKVQLEGDYDKAKAFMNRWAQVPPEIPPLVERLTDLPLEVAPTFNV